MWFRLICCGIIGDRNAGCFLPTVVVGGWDCGWAWIYSKTFHSLKAEAGSDSTGHRLRFCSFSCSNMPSDAHCRFENGSSDTPLLFLRERPCLTLTSSPNAKVWKEHSESSEKERLSTLNSQIGCLSVILSRQERRPVVHSSKITLSLYRLLWIARKECKNGSRLHLGQDSKFSRWTFLPP